MLPDTIKRCIELLNSRYENEWGQCTLYKKDNKLTICVDNVTLGENHILHYIVKNDKHYRDFMFYKNEKYKIPVYQTTKYHNDNMTCIVFMDRRDH